MKFKVIAAGMLATTLAFAKQHKANDAWISRAPWAYAESGLNTSKFYIDTAYSAVTIAIERPIVTVTLWSRNDYVVHDTVITTKWEIRFDGSASNSAGSAKMHCVYILITRRNGNNLTSSDFENSDWQTIVPGSFGEVLRLYAQSRVIQYLSAQNSEPK